MYMCVCFGFWESNAYLRNIAFYVLFERGRLDDISFVGKK